MPKILANRLSSKLFVLSVLYFVQGLPYGFQLVALPVYLRAEGMSLTGIGLASALSLPWSLKVIWGPAVDRWGSERLGRRRSWILPLQAALGAVCAVAAFVEPSAGLMALMVLVLAMNLFASTLDVAVDGLAVDLLRPHELGYGNIAQVVGYKVGILTGGGVLVWASGRIGWNGLFLIMSGLVFLSLIVTLMFREPGSSREIEPEGVDDGVDDGETGPPPTMAGVIDLLVRSFRTRGALWILLFIGTYKLGESMADAMFKPFLYDAGFTAEQIGLWVGTWGLVFSLLGSVVGGLLASRIGVVRAVAVTASLRALAVGGEWWLSLVDPTAGKVIGVVAAEQLFGGALTTAMFAFMMSRVDRRIGATHYTLFATVEVTGKLMATWISGILADATGYPTLFGTATVFAIAFLALLWPITRMVVSQAPGDAGASGDVGTSEDVASTTRD
jgi:MFS family permease